MSDRAERPPTDPANASAGASAPSAAVPAAEQTRPRPALRPLRFLVPYVLRYKGRLACAFLALIAASTATLALPLAVRRMIDFGFATDNALFIDRYFSMLVVVAGALALASSLRYYLVITLGERVVADIRADVFRHVVGLSSAFFDRTLSGEIVSRLTADTTQIKSAVGASASIALRNLVMFVGAVVMMIVTSPWLSALALSVIPLIVLPLVAFGRIVRRKSRAAQDRLAHASAFATEAIGAVRALQAFTSEYAAADRYGAETDHAFREARAATRARAMLTGAAIFIVFSTVVGVLWLGAQDVLTGALTPGALGQFVLYAVLAAGGLGELSQVWGEIAQTAGAAERLAQLLREQPEITSPERPVALPARPAGRVAFEGVVFSYPSERISQVLDDVSFTIAPGQSVAIVGPSGAGKSTVFNLILRYYDPLSGRVTIDDVDLRDLALHDARNAVALVPQDTIVFATSILENIRLGRPDATDAEVREAARAARVDEFVGDFPAGYDTVVGERGLTLSGGQRQRLAIARAILKDAPILLLDEATSSLDAESEAAIQDALERLMKDRTTIVIAHRLATVTSADRILVLEAGRVIEEGTHESLMAGSGLYARLARLQFDQGRSRLEGAATLRPDAAA